MATKLTTKAVETIRPSAKRQEIADALLPGLYLVVQPSGARSWAVRYRANGRTRKHTLGPLPRIDLKAARELGAAALRAAASGGDPALEKKQARADSVELAAAQFLERHCRRNYRPKTLRQTEWYLQRFILPRFGGQGLGTVTRAEIRDMLERVVGDAPVLANRLHSVTRKFFAWCVEQEMILASPLAGLKAPAQEKSRDRILSDPELARVWDAAGTLGDPIYGGLVRLAVLTGQRRGEVAGLEWGEIDLKNRLINLPAARTKNGRAHDVPLNRQAIALIEGLPRTSDRYVFSYDGVRPINGYGKPKARLDALLPKDTPGWTLHDIRRTVASGMARLGVSLPVIEKILNHVSGSFAGVVGIYQRHDFAAEKRAALDAWSAHIQKITRAKAK